MAHQLTNDQVDALAAEHAANVTAATPAAPATYTTLAYGAEGEEVTKLVDLLAVLGYDTNTVIKGGPATLDETVLADVKAAQASLQVTEPQLAVPMPDIPIGVKGQLVGQATWNALYAAAAAKLETPEQQA